MLLAGDVGGTKTLLGLFTPSPSRPAAVDVARIRHARLPRARADGRSEFLESQGVSRAAIDAACFGVAGAVTDQVARLTNVPWRIDCAAVGRARSASARTSLLNDLEALAYGVTGARADELASAGGRPCARGNAAVIAAGTGLGEALLLNVDGRLVPGASEGGHADFGARTPRELDMVRDLTRIFGRVSVEHVLSGPGIVNIYQFTHDAFGTGPMLTPHSIAPATAVRRRSARSTTSADLPARDQRGGSRAALPAVRRDDGDVRRRRTAPRRATSRCAPSRPPASTSAAASRRRFCPRSRPARSCEAFLAKSPMDELDRDDSRRR